MGTTHEPLLSFCPSVFFCAYCHFQSSEPLPVCLCLFLNAANREGFFLLASHFAAVTTVRLTVCSGAKVNFSRWFTLARIPAHYRGKQWLLTARGSKRTSVSMATAADSRRSPCALNMPCTDGAQISRCWLHRDTGSGFDLQEKSWIRSPQHLCCFSQTELKHTRCMLFNATLAYCTVYTVYWLLLLYIACVTVCKEKSFKK